jgi:drug/metabolite transporter (DMT)-like permease
MRSTRHRVAGLAALPSILLYTPRVPRTERSASWLLFVVPSFIWGTTWLAIKFQLGEVAPEVSVSYRFGVAAALLFLWCASQGIRLGFDLRTHAGLALLGFLQFGLNYVLVYASEQHLSSGLVAVVFALQIVWNLAGSKLFFGSSMPGPVLFGAALGLSGVMLVFWPELAGLGRSPSAGLGLAMAVSGSLVSSGGNLFSQRIFGRGVEVAPGTAWAMAYASAMLALSCALRGIPFAIEVTFPYLASLAYLSLFGSVFAFVAYLTLIKRVGAGRSGYSAVLVPVLAMLLSTLFEGYRWTGLAVLGMALVAGGNLLVMQSRAGPSSRANELEVGALPAANSNMYERAEPPRRSSRGGK